MTKSAEIKDHPEHFAISDICAVKSNEGISLSFENLLIRKYYFYSSDNLLKDVPIIRTAGNVQTEGKLVKGYPLTVEYSALKTDQRAPDLFVPWRIQNRSTFDNGSIS